MLVFEPCKIKYLGNDLVLSKATQGIRIPSKISAMIGTEAVES
jgi:hypothetical protein